jgi:hypothetical protein
MITTRSEFEDETAWERSVIALTVPLMPLVASGADLDLRTRDIKISVSSAVNGSEAVEELRNSLLPLVFGAAWKILDLALELAFALGGLSPQKGTRWTIAEKSRHALAKNGSLPGFVTSAPVWQSLGPLYAGTSEVRHALVHRRVQVEPSTRELRAFDSNGNPLPVLSYEEQLAFCRIAQRLAQAVCDGELTPRVELDLLGQLAALRRHHGLVITSKTAARPPVRVIDSFPSGGIIDVPWYLSAGQATFPGAHFVDIELHLLDGRVLAGELDTAPQDKISVNLGNLPSWLRFL